MVILLPVYPQTAAVYAVLADWEAGADG